jgi:hypothetical protein
MLTNGMERDHTIPSIRTARFSGAAPRAVVVLK